MAEQLQFGDLRTADIKLQLISTDGAEYQRNPVYLHSDVLRKSEFYDTLMSERWSSDKKRPLEIEITSRYCGQIYIKCIQLMYYSYAGERLCFANVDEALAILPVASEILFRQCLEECMKYLNAVPWSIIQEVKLRALLLSLEIYTLPDLTARLGMSDMSDHGGLQMLEQSLQKMLSTFSSGSFDDGEYIEEYIVAHFEVNASFAATCRSALLKEFTANARRVHNQHEIPIAFSALSWIVNVIQRCEGELFELVLNMFCKDAEIPKAVNHYLAGEYSYCSYRIVDNSGYSKRLVGLLDRFLKALGNGRIITGISFRVSFLANWIGIFVNLDKDRLTKSIVEVAETLPLDNQRSIYNIAKEAMNKYWSVDSYTKETIEGWGKKVQNAIRRHNNFFDMTGRIY